MERIMLTGGSGFIGRNISSLLKKSYCVYAPSRKELDLYDPKEVRKFIDNKRIDIVVHCANPNPVKNPADKKYDMLDASLRLFLNLYEARSLFDKMIYIGSGAEYDKTLDISNITEQECFRSIPKDAYGFAKYIMNRFAHESRNIYNLCLFACYGPYDHHTKFITHCINCCMNHKSITIRQECRFDYIHVSDLANMVLWMCKNEMKYHMYNASGGKNYLLSEIAREVMNQMHADVSYEFLKPGLNKEYTADGKLFYKESGLKPVISLKKGIEMQIEYELQKKIVME